MLYFESCGIAAVYSEIHEEERYAIVCFEVPAVVSLACLKKDNALFGTHLQVQPCSDFLGLSPSSFWLDPALDKMRFVKESSNLVFELEKVLAEHHAHIMWTKEKILVQCTMTPTEMSHRNLLRSWKDVAYQEIQLFIAEHVNTEVLSFPAANWTDVKEVLKYMSVADPTTVYAHLDTNTYRVIIVGYKGYKKSDMQAILDKLKDLSEPE